MGWLPISLVPWPRQDIILHVAMDRVSNFVEFWAIFRLPSPHIGLVERRFISELVNSVCHWLFIRLLQ